MMKKENEKTRYFRNRKTHLESKISKNFKNEKDKVIRKYNTMTKKDYLRYFTKMENQCLK